MNIFFFPYELNEKQNRPSQTRPLKMLNAFKTNGGVIEVVGKARDLMIDQIQKNLKRGLCDDIEFVYVESINKPLFVQCIFEKKINIFSDYLFFLKCKRNDIPLVVFYRDARWISKRYKTLVPKYSYHILKLVFYIEFKLFEYLFDVFFLPSIEMSKVLPFKENKVHVEELPSAVDFLKYQYKNEIRKENNRINLLYVGNINPDFYNISPMLKSVKNNTSVKLNICCRKSDWDQFNEYYNLKKIKNIQIHHLEGERLEELYRESDVHIMLYAKDDYRTFAVPFKLYESLQYHIPIITNDGTKAASLVRELDVGWVITNQAEVTKLFSLLNSDKSLLIEKKKNISRIIKDNTWHSRAEKVIEVCRKKKNKNAL